MVLVIRDVLAITMDGMRRALPHAAIVIDGERIVDIGDAERLATKHAGADVLDGQGMMAVPGFIDAHAHPDQSLLRGLTDDLHWIPFISDRIRPYGEQRNATMTAAAYRLAALEMVKAGTTSFVSPNVPAREVGLIHRALVDVGPRAALAIALTPTADGASSRRQARTTITHELAAATDQLGSAVSDTALWLGLGVPRQDGLGSFPHFYREAVDQARDRATRITYHFSSEREDVDYYEQAFGTRPVPWAKRHHILGPNVLLINACWLSADDIEVVAATGTSVAHSPSANMKMASGIAPIVELLAAGVSVGLGTDGGANNNSHDLVREMKAACLLQNIANMRPGALGAWEALEMATIGGAKAIGRYDELGSIEAGKQADIVLIDLEQPHSSPVRDPVSNLVYAAHGGNVDTVLVGGRVVMRHRTMTGVDEESILHEARVQSEKLAAMLRPADAPRRSGPSR